jgi:hypothetical protein
MGRIAHRVHQLPDLLVLASLTFDERQARKDDRQEIVEVMGNPASQAADSLHFLRLTELFFQLPPCSNIFCRTDDAHNLARGAADRKGSIVNPADCAVRPLNSIDFVEIAGR